MILSNLNEITFWVHDWTRKLASHPMMLISKLTLSSMLRISLIIRVWGGIKDFRFETSLGNPLLISWLFVLHYETLKNIKTSNVITI